MNRPNIGFACEYDSLNQPHPNRGHARRGPAPRANSAEFLVAWATAQNKLIEMPTLGWHCDRAKARSVHLAFYFIHLLTSGEFTMTQTNEASTLHKKAASEHEAAAKHHHKAAECHDHNKTSDAKISSKSAMDCCNTAQKNTKAACDCSDK
jgi:hypothetical protein